jgi:hypothetical protein
MWRCLGGRARNLWVPTQCAVSPCPKGWRSYNACLSTCVVGDKGSKLGSFIPTVLLHGPTPCYTRPASFSTIIKNPTTVPWCSTVSYSTLNSILYRERLETVRRRADGAVIPYKTHDVQGYVREIFETCASGGAKTISIPSYRTVPYREILPTRT